MRPVGLTMPFYFRRSLFTLVALSWVTGLSYFLMERYFQVDGEFGLEPHYLQLPSLALHGASAFLVMILFGAVIFNHAPLAWRTGRVRRLGISLFICVSIQIVSAYLLYYLANESAREISEWVHLVSGFLLPFIVLTHVIAAIRSKQ